MNSASIAASESTVAPRLSSNTYSSALVGGQLIMNHSSNASQEEDSE